MKKIALFLLFVSPAVLAETINIACPPGDKVTVHAVTNDGDFDGDGDIDKDDVDIMRANFGQPTDPNNETILTDLNGDGITNFADLSLFKMLTRNSK